MSSLKEQAAQFATALTKTVSAVARDFEPFTADVVEGGHRALIKQARIPLTVDDRVILVLAIEYRCCMDRTDEFMAIEKSSFAVFPGGKKKREPLFRYDYLREPDNVPAAHVQIHAHRDAFTATMVRSGKTSKRAARRAADDGVPRLAELHFPLGGHRFRLCLEDVLHMLIEEFGIDRGDDAFNRLNEGRLEWRRTQTRAAVRDDPESAVAVLRAMGYDVSFPDGKTEPEVRRDRLIAR
ncbi:hypothetical protein [Brevibacterium litoralis]|uniref:hypothetical protein n=1 Tax=Brevibacterium litoralis TaxID=3138935 RepID=UPI0032EF8D07